MKDNEIKWYDDFDWNEANYYEVEIWKTGDCESHFFTTKTAAKKYLNENKSTTYDCIKKHEAGDCYII